MITATSNFLASSRKEARFPVDIDMYRESLTIIRVSDIQFPADKYTINNVESCNNRVIDILEKIRKKVEGLGENVKRPLPDGLKLLEELRDIGADAFALLDKRATLEISKIEEEEKDRGI